MIKFFLRIILALILMTNGCSGLSAPSDKKLIKLTTISQDHATQSEADSKRMLRVTGVINAAAGDGQEVAKLEPGIKKAFSRFKTKFQERQHGQQVKKVDSIIKQAFSRLETNFQEWDPVHQVTQLGSRIKQTFSRFKTEYQDLVQEYKTIKRYAKIGTKLIKWYVIVEMKIEAFIKWIRGLFGFETKKKEVGAIQKFKRHTKE